METLVVQFLQLQKLLSSAQWHEKMGLLVVVMTFLTIIVHRLIVRRSILLPPGPWMWPLVGVIPFLGSLPHQALANLAQQYGPLMYVRFGSTPCIVVSSSMLAEKFLKTHDQVFQNRPKTLVGKVFNLDNAIALSSGPHWRHLRKICSTQLFTPTYIQSFEVVRKNEISLIMNEIYVEANASKVVNLKYHMSAIATNSLAQMIFSKRCVMLIVLFNTPTHSVQIVQVICLDKFIIEVRFHSAFMLLKLRNID